MIHPNAEITVQHEEINIINFLIIPGADGERGPQDRNIRKTVLSHYNLRCK
jgi:hypothetical protein